jgi:hypothetical protein
MTEKEFELENDKIYGFSDALYNAICPICKDNIEWEADFDADGTTYGADHEDCGLSFGFGEWTVKAYIEEYEK